MGLPFAPLLPHLLPPLSRKHGAQDHTPRGSLEIARPPPPFIFQSPHRNQVTFPRSPSEFVAEPALESGSSGSQCSSALSTTQHCLVGSRLCEKAAPDLSPKQGAKGGHELSQVQTKIRQVEASRSLFLAGTQSSAAGAMAIFGNLSSPFQRVTALLLTVTRQMDPSPPPEVNLCSQGLMA